MKKILIIATFVLALSMIPSRAHALFIVDTGPLPDPQSVVGLYNIPSEANWIAGQFTTIQNWNISSVEAIFQKTLPGTISFALYGDDSNTVDITNELFRQSFNVPASATGSFDTGWYGVTGMNLNLSPGSYWAAFEVLNIDDYSGGVAFPAPNPLLRHAFRYTPVSTDYVTELNSNTPIVLRVGAEASNVVPEPASILLLGGGMLGAFLNCRKSA